MAKYSNMSLFQASAKALDSRLNEQKRRIYEDKYNWYRQIKAWNFPKHTYERDSWRSFIKDPDFRIYILGIK